MFYIIIEKETARQILRRAPGVVIIDDRELNSFPTPLGVWSLSFSLSLCLPLSPSLSHTHVRADWGMRKGTFVFNMGVISVVNIGIK